MLRLRKWYGDCVSPEGEVAILYWARLGWGPVRIPYAASLHAGVARHPREVIRYRSSPEPAPCLSGLEWRSATGVVANWSPRIAGRSLLLHDSEECRVSVDVRVPSGSARFGFPDGETVEGHGYAECLSLAVRRGKLPLDELRWGRFIAPDTSIVWIDWRGATCSRRVLVDGIERTGLMLSDTRLRVDSMGAELLLEDHVVVRDASLRSGALKGLPRIARVLLGGIADSLETRWLSRGTFRVAGSAHQGWALHEHVRFAGR